LTGDVRGIVFRYESFEVLERELGTAGDDQELSFGRAEDLRDGEWVLATFTVGDEATSVAACVLDTGTETRLTFASRDWEKLWGFARGAGPSSAPPENLSSPPCQIHPPPGVRVLVVDEDTDLRRVLKGVLSASGFAADAVSCAEEAVAYVSCRRVDLLVLDWNRPGTSGAHLCTELRREPRLGKVPVLVLTPHCSPGDQIAAFAAGADDVVPKPFRAPELGARVLGLLHRTPSYAPGRGV
jgi:two-component system, OmpR family, phosphate regulon response regulator PhoB